ncbi:MAG: hypothetical protein JK586_18365, partial [Nocardiopsis sp. BM-2018]
MTSISSPEDLTISESGFQSFLTSRQEPEWLSAKRQEAWQLYSDMQWPSRKEEQWMRSDLRGFSVDRYRLPSMETNRSLEASGIPQWLSEGVVPAGVIQTLDGVVFSDLSDAAKTHPQIVQRFLHSIVQPNVDRFAALHAAVWSGGQFLYVPRGVVVDCPFRVAAGLSDGCFDSGHTLIVIEEGAEAAFLYESNSSEEHSGGLH